MYELEDGAFGRSLYMLPRRLRHVAFIRPGSYVLVDEDEQKNDDSKIRGQISSVILAEHVRELRGRPEWPDAFQGTAVPAAESGSNDNSERNQRSEASCENSDASYSSSEPDIPTNPNRPKYEMFDSSEEDGEDDQVEDDQVEDD